MRKGIPARGHTIKAHPVANRCFGCGPANPRGMHLNFYLDETNRRTFCRFRLSKRYQGPPGHCHGGIIATILDEAMGKVNKFRSVVALTKAMEIEYLKPVPLGQSLITEGWEQSVRGRKHINLAEIRNEKNEVLARGRGVFIVVDVQKMFARHLSKDQPQRTRSTKV